MKFFSKKQIIRTSKETQARQNQNSVIIDGIGVGIVAGIMTFLAVFLARLGASPVFVSLLTSIPAFIGLLLVVPIGSYLEQQQDLVPWYSRARIGVQASFVLMGILPFFIPLTHVAIAIIIIWTIATIPQIIVNITFTTVMSTAIESQYRQQLMSWRWSLLGVASALAVANAEQGSYAYRVCL